MSTSGAYQTATGSLVPFRTGSQVPQLCRHNILLTGRYLPGYVPPSLAKSFSTSNKLEKQAILCYLPFNFKFTDEKNNQQQKKLLSQ